MKASYLLTLLPAALAAATLPFEDASAEDLYRRADNYAQIKAALTKSATDAQKFAKDLNQIPNNGPITPSQQIKLQNDDAAITNDLQRANNACSSTSNFSNSQSKTGYNDLVSLEQLVESVLQDVVNHKAAFQSAGLIDLVCNDLQNLKAQVDTLGPCLTSHSSQQYASKGPALQAKYDADFNNAMSSLGC